MGVAASLFQQQSYRDSWQSLVDGLENRQGAVLWDAVYLTASNEVQADAYRAQVETRLAKGQLPRLTHYAVLLDPDGVRVGSGGATLNAIRHIRDVLGGFAGRQVLIIHSGGDSKPVPQYSACGKLFSPVRRMLPDGWRSTLVDEFIIGMSGVPARMTDGALECSGDVLLLFNPLNKMYGSRVLPAEVHPENISAVSRCVVRLRDKMGALSGLQEPVRYLITNTATDHFPVIAKKVFFEKQRVRQSATIIIRVQSKFRLPWSIRIGTRYCRRCAHQTSHGLTRLPWWPWALRQSMKRLPASGG